MSAVLYQWGWSDDRPVPVTELKAWVPSPAVQYGMGLFEGIRAYPRDGGVGVVALREHMERLYEAAEASAFNFRPPIDLEAAISAVTETLRRNAVREGCYIRPCLYHEGSGHVALRKGAESPTRFAIYLQRWDEAYLKPEGVRCVLSGVPKPNFAHARMKTSGNYVLCTEAKSAAVAAGYDNCIMLDCRGFVAEAASENLILQFSRMDILADEPGMEERQELRHVFVEPEWTDAPILPGITARILRETVAPALGFEFTRRRVPRTDLNRVQGVLLTGTAAETVHATAIAGTEARLAFTQELRALVAGYRDLTEGRDHQEWVTHVVT